MYAPDKGTQTVIKESADHTKKAAQQTTVAAKETKVAAEATLTTAERALQISADQLVFAAERTYAAWLRTGLVALASGIGSRKLLGGVVHEWLVTGAGSVLTLFSAFCFGAGIWRHLRPGLEAPLKANVAPIPAPVLVFVSSFLALVALATLYGIVFGAVQ